MRIRDSIEPTQTYPAEIIRGRNSIFNQLALSAVFAFSRQLDTLDYSYFLILLT